MDGNILHLLIHFQQNKCLDQNSDSSALRWRLVMWKWLGVECVELVWFGETGFLFPSPSHSLLPHSNELQPQLERTSASSTLLFHINHLESFILATRYRSTDVKWSTMKSSQKHWNHKIASDKNTMNCDAYVGLVMNIGNLKYRKTILMNQLYCRIV